MSWAARRRLFVSLIVGTLVTAFLAVVFIAAFYDAPSCSDGTQNQGEDGVDCGGPCAYLCTDQTLPPTVLFTKALASASGRTDVIASVENKNSNAAARNVPYRISLYGKDRLPIGEFSGVLDLPPGATVPVFLPGLSSGKQAVAGAFLEINPSAPQWFYVSSDPRTMPRVTNTTQSGSADAPRIDATLVNDSVTPLTNVRIIIFIRDVKRDIIAASQTVVPLIRAQSSATATFTWNSAFAGLPAAIEVVPIISLPPR